MLSAHKIFNEGLLTQYVLFLIGVNVYILTNIKRKKKWKMQKTFAYPSPNNDNLTLFITNNL